MKQTGSKGSTLRHRTPEGCGISSGLTPSGNLSQPKGRGRRQVEESKYNIQLDPDDKMLIDLRDKLFAGSWQIFLSELRAQLKKSPSIFRFKTISRIKSDILRIKRLKYYETRRKINVKDLI